MALQSRAVKVAGHKHWLVRPEDVVVRHGGDELLIVLRGVGVEIAQRVAARMERAIGEYDGPNGQRITVCAGAAPIQHGR